MPIDVTSLYNRRADNRWERVCVGDILERVTWSRPDPVLQPPSVARLGSAGTGHAA